MKENTSPEMLLSTEPKSGWVWLLGIVFVALGLFVALSPFWVTLPGFGLDPSWMAVLGEAPALRIGLGRDIVLTFGPLSAIYTHWFAVDRLPLNLGLYVFLITALSVLVASLAKQNGRFGAVVLFGFLALTCADPMVDAVFFTAPTLTALVALSSAGRSINSVAVAGGLIATAIAALTKFSIVPLAILDFLICDIVLACNRRTPCLTVGFLAFFYAGFALVEEPASFFDFVRGSIIVSAGYSEAMAVPGSLVELEGFGAAGTFALALMLFYEFGALREGRVGWPDAAARCLIVLAMAFISFKGGFVRQDLHTLIAWAGMALAATIYALAAPRTSASLTNRSVLPLLLGLALFIAVVVNPLVWSSYGTTVAQSFARWRSHISSDFSDATEFAKHPSTWIAQKKHEKELAWDRVRKILPLPALAGTVDTLPSIQSSILAHGLKYQPRWSFQEYVTFAVPLSERNIADIETDGPDYLLFDPAITNIDGRYPSLAEGPLWPFLLNRYAPVSQAGSVLVLKRLIAHDPVELLGPVTASTIRFGETMALSGTAPLFMKVKINKTITGRLANILFRASLVHVRVTLADGSTVIHRIIPAMAQSGFIISPYIASSTDYAALSLGEPQRSNRAVGVSFESGRLGSLMYAENIALELREVRIPALDHITNASPETRQYVDEHIYMMRLASNPGIAVVPEGLLAHAPKTVEITVDKPASRMVVGFGLRDQAWSRPDGTDGVCFTLTHINGGSETPLLQRCLDPMKNDGDRGEQVNELTATLKPGDVLRLKTSCNKDCRYDWSYWSRLTPENP
jgi:hypothetical protein